MEILTNPLTYIVGLVVIFSVLEYRKQKNCSSKSCEANKTSTPTTPKRARKGGKFVADDPKTPQNEACVGGKAPKKRATKKTPTKKRATKKTATKRTPKKSGTKN